MGRIDDALKKAQVERAKKRRAKVDEEPAVEPTAAESVRPTVEPARTRTVRAPRLDSEAAPRSADAKRSTTEKSRSTILAGLEKAGEVARGAAELLIVSRDPSDPRSEQFRAIKTNLHALDPEPTVLGFTSAVEDEGASAVVTNLACIFAEERSTEILVIDANLRDRNTSQILGISADAPGLTDVLSGAAEPDEVITRCSVPHVHVIPPGRHSSNPGGLLSHARLGEALKIWSNRFERVFVDTPPVLNFTDAAMIGRHLDGVILVVKLGETARNLVDEALEQMSGARLRIFGCVLTNAADPEFHALDVDD